MEIRSVITVILLLAGFAFILVSTIGVLRMPDFYTRMHAAGIGGTAGLALCCLGLFIYEGLTVTGAKILMLLIFVSITSPIGTHIIGKVAYRDSLQNEKNEEK